MSTPTVGSARIGLVPSAQGFMAKADAELQGPAKELGESLGRTIGKSIADSLGGPVRDKLLELRQELRVVGDLKIGVNLDDGAALAKAEGLKAELGGIGDSSTAIRGVESAVGALGASATETGSIALPGIGVGAAIAATVAAPALAVIATGAAAVASTVVVATAGLAALAAVAIPTIKSTLAQSGALSKAQAAYAKATTSRATALLAEQAATKGLTREQVGFLGSIAHFKGVFAGLVADFKPEVLSLATQALNLFALYLPVIKPLIAAAAQGLGDLFKNGSSFLPVVKQIVGAFAQAAPKTIVDLGTLFANLVLDGGKLVVLLLPLGERILPHLVSGAQDLGKKLSTLGTNPKFLSFIAYMQANAPLIAKDFGEFVVAFVKFGVAVAPISTAVLKALVPALHGLSYFITGLRVSFYALEIAVVETLLGILKPINTLVQHLPGVPASIKKAVGDSVTSLQGFDTSAKASLNALKGTATTGGAAAGTALADSFADGIASTQAAKTAAANARALAGVATSGLRTRSRADDGRIYLGSRSQGQHNGRQAQAGRRT